MQFSHYSIWNLVHIFNTGKRIKVTIVAFVPAERNMNVDTCHMGRSEKLLVLEQKRGVSKTDAPGPAPQLLKKYDVFVLSIH
jgi:hypothetical protein